MKRAVFIFLIVILASFTTSKEPITISGKIANSDTGIIWIKGTSFEKEIKLNPDGTFSEFILIPYDGVYSLETDKNVIPLYLANGTILRLNTDNKKFLSSLKYNGKGSVENQYLVQKSVIASQITDKELYSLPEKNFLIKVEEIKKSITSLANKTKFSAASFRETETKNIHYMEQKHLLYYRNYRSFLTGLPDYQVSEQFPNLDTRIDYDNEKDYLFSDDYKLIAIEKFNENERITTTNQNSDINKINNLKALTSQSLKNQLIQIHSYEISSEFTNFEQIYNAYISITDDPALIKNLTVLYMNAKSVETNMPSPLFNYENQKGGKTSLESLKGKYIYIDVWATWCGPCIQENPYLQKIEEQFKDKNIAFVSISVDAAKDHDKWNSFVIQKNLGGIQLLADQQFDSDFIKAYGIIAIPRFILIDPKGNIIKADAPKPSDVALIELFNSLQL